MRILHVIDTCQLRGAEMFASDLIRTLNRAGVSQRVGVLRDSGGKRVRYDAQTHLLGSDGWMAPGLRIHPRAVRRLRRLIGKWRPDVIQAHGGNTLKYAVPALLSRRGTLVYRKIGLTPSETIGPLRRTVHGLLMRRADRIVAVGEAVRRETIGMFRVPAQQVITIPNAVDPIRMRVENGREATRRALGIPLSAPVILSLGALTWEKDPIAHVEIGARVRRHRPDTYQIIAGDGPLREEVESRLRRQDGDGRVRLLPARADVPELLAMSDVLLLASRTEGIPGCLIEAGMLGIPAAAYAVGGVPEVVVDGVTGRLTPAGDADGLASSVLELLANLQVSRAMREAARERCISLFDIARVAPRYLQLYEELVAS